MKVSLAVAIVALAMSGLASAPANAGWFVEGEELVGSSSLATTAAVEERPKLTFSETTIECTGTLGAATSPQIESPDKASAASVTLKECATTAGSTCSIVSQPVNLSTMPVTALVEEAGEEDVAVFKPKTKATFMTINFTGASCALSGVQPVTGSAAILWPRGQVENVVHKGVANLVSGALKVGTAEAILKGIGKLAQVAKKVWAWGKKLLTPSCILHTFEEPTWYKTQDECLNSKKTPPGGTWERQ